MSDLLFFGLEVDESSFLFVYDLVCTPSSASAVVDDEGRWTYLQGASATFTGYASSPDAKTIDTAREAGTEVDCVVMAAHSLVVKVEDKITIPVGFGGSPLLVGDYVVTLVRPNPSHTRILTRRVVGTDAPHFP